VLEPPGDAKDDIWIIAQLAKRLGFDWGEVTPRSAWDELRSISPMHAGMTYERLEELEGIQWPCYDEEHDGTLYLHAGCGRRTATSAGPSAVQRDAVRAPGGRAHRGVPVPPHDRPPAGLVQHRGADGGYTSHCDVGETIDLSPEDADRLDVAEGEVVRVTSRRGSLEVPGSGRPGLRPDSSS
jgi:formate dehydrogenase major subunit